jgi:toxin ParE1/3/4
LHQITKTRLAEEDLDEIWLYIAKDNLAAADQLLDQVGNSCHLLAHEPLMGRARPELSPNLRSLSVARYVIFYTPSTTGIEIVRVLHSARDIGPPHFASDVNA